MSQSLKQHRSSFNLTLDDNFEIDLSESHIFGVVLGSPVSMTGTNSNAISDNMSVTNYTVTINKTVEHVIQLVLEFSGGIDEKLVFFINAYELVVDIIPMANQDIMLMTIE